MLSQKKLIDNTIIECVLTTQFHNPDRYRGISLVHRRAAPSSRGRRSRRRHHHLTSALPAKKQTLSAREGQLRTTEALHSANNCFGLEF
jgi:hypothetical protein